MAIDFGLGIRTLQALGEEASRDQALALNAQQARIAQQTADQRAYDFGVTQRRDAARGVAAQQLGAGDYAGATATASNAGDFELVTKIAGLRADQRKQLGEEADFLGRAAFALKRVPVGRRALALQRYAPAFARRGFDASELAALDTSDEGLDGYVAMGQTVQQALASDLTQARIDDVSVDNARADTLATNTIANTQARLALARNADARGARADARASEARAEGRVRFRERDKDRAAIAAGGGRGGIPTNTDDLDY